MSRPESVESTIDISEIQKRFPAPPRLSVSIRKALPPLPPVLESPRATTVLNSFPSPPRSPAKPLLKSQAEPGKEFPALLMSSFNAAYPPPPLPKDPPRPFTASTNAVSFSSAESKRTIKYGTGKFSAVELSPQPSDDPDDPLNWPLWRKHLNFAALLFMVALIGVMKTIFVSTNSVVALSYSVSYTAAVALTAVPLMISAFTGTLSLVAGRLWGKRPVYLGSTLFIFIGVVMNMQVLGSFSQNMAARAFQGLGWGAFETLVLSSIQDTYFNHRRFLAILNPVVGLRGPGDRVQSPKRRATDTDGDSTPTNVVTGETNEGRGPGVPHRDEAMVVQGRLDRLQIDPAGTSSVYGPNNRAVVCCHSFALREPLEPSELPLLVILTHTFHATRFTRTIHVVTVAVGTGVASIGILGFGLYVRGAVQMPVDSSAPSTGSPWDARFLGDRVSFLVVSCLLAFLGAGSLVLDATIRPAIQRSTAFTSSSLLVALRNTADMQGGLACLRNLAAGIVILGLPNAVWTWDGLKSTAVGIGVAQIVVAGAVCFVWWYYDENVRQLDGRLMGLVDLTVLQPQGSFFDTD
ncbi:hypothetical protein DL766_008777 [Monosporascus sp. MC13-8B]|uniref:Major facilitator superfamily (MFS) profile domain-containing protein n=1 Tax=Monosporascus cannonballus TaxID=155416 RepID=A0ABY0HG38_9PEZI|nr:hypothetical protein DL762_001565 [Monosporascus cannonballus]RYP18008.1 hypothetical protein DL766_008777 [Monosporascus sp. MC13-8B]